MEIQQGFNRIAVLVAMTFLGLSVICLIFAGVNYLEYRNEIAVEYKRFFATEYEERTTLSFAREPEEKMQRWNRLKEFRYRSVGQTMELAMMCLISAVLALMFWFLVGHAYVAFSYRSKLPRAGSK